LTGGVYLEDKGGRPDASESRPQGKEKKIRTV